MCIDLNLTDPGEQTEKIESFLQNKKREIGFEQGVIGLSGGIDSSVCSVLAQQALGAKNLDVVFLPDNSTPRQDRKDVEKLNESFGFDVRVEEIGDMITNLKQGFDSPSQLTVANVKARLRMIILYAIANEKNGLVIGTGNRSEWLLGYFTKHGDGAADVSPLLHLYKTELFSLASHLGIPDSVISKPPSAGLWEGQTDEEEIGGSYQDIDQILFCLNELSLDSTQTKEKLNLDPAFIDKVFRMVKESTHKREKPPSLARR